MGLAAFQFLRKPSETPQLLLLTHCLGPCSYKWLLTAAFTAVIFQCCAVAERTQTVSELQQLLLVFQDISGHSRDSPSRRGVLSHPWPGTGPWPRPWWPPRLRSPPWSSGYLPSKHDRKNTAGIIFTSGSTSKMKYFGFRICPDINWNFRFFSCGCCCFKDKIGNHFTKSQQRADHLQQEPRAAAPSRPFQFKSKHLSAWNRW